jgi:hypothetical protein
VFVLVSVGYKHPSSLKISHPSHNMKGKKYIYAHKFEGMPKLTDLELQDDELPAVKDGGTVCSLLT